MISQTTTDLLLAWDAHRPRTQQTELGMSSLGGCRRKAGYHIQGYAPDPSYKPNGVQAVMGSAIHWAASEGAGILIPDALAEKLEVHFAGLKGHPDLYHDRTLRDVKTLGYDTQLEARRDRGPQQRELWQTMTYAAALIVAGYPVDEVEIDYVVRDSGNEWIWRGPFDIGAVREAMAWLEDVRNSDVALLTRDYRPDSAVCKHCPWFRRCWDAAPDLDPLSVLFVEDPDAAKWARRLLEAQERAEQARRDIEEAQGALDHLRTVRFAGESEEIRVPGLEGQVIRFTMRRGRSTWDREQIEADYARANAVPPRKRGEPTVQLRIAKAAER